MKSTALVVALFVVSMVLAAGAGALRAQTRLDVPPPLPAETKAADARTAADTKPAARIESRIDSPDADIEHPLPPAKITSPETRIEQRRQGNRVVEIVVTPAGSTRSYVIQNREGMRPLSPDELSAGLSTPRFLRFDF